MYSDDENRTNAKKVPQAEIERQTKILEKTMVKDKQVSKIKKVTESENGYEIAKEDGWSLWLDKKFGIMPKVGDEIVLYGQIGFPIQGIDIAGKEAYFKTQAQLDKEHEDFCKKVREDRIKEHEETIKRIKNDKPYETVDISGIGGSYEWGCQIMLQAGLEFLKAHPDFHFDYRQNPHIIGVATTDTLWGKELDKVLWDASEKFGKQYGATGAMHQFVVNHLMFIQKNGYEKWLEEFKDRVYIYPNIPRTRC